jgi:type IV secretory pathway VirD2 relaxase
MIGVADRDEFEPELGRIRSRGSGRRFQQRVLQATALAGGRGRGGRGARLAAFHGSRVGRGAGVGRVLAARDRYAAHRQRRVIVKARIVRLSGAGLGAARAHLRYIQRDGVTRDGEPGQLYSAEKDRADGRAFLDRSAGDRHQFRLIVSAEDGAAYDDLKPFIRRLMAGMEEDLGTKLDWVAVDHHNTGHPHSHVILRGRTENGQDLVIAREYLTRGIRERAAEIVSLDLGPRSDLEIEDRLRREIDQERFTSIDRELLRERDGDGLVGTGEADPFRQALRAGRLQKLRRLDLAEEVEPGRWRLAPELEPMLRRMGERGDILKTLHRELADKGLTRAAANRAIYDPSDPAARPITGRLLRRGVSDEVEDRHYLIVDGVDGRAHYVEIGRGDATEPIPEGAVVGIAPKRAEPRPVDRTIVDIAAVSGGRYSVEIHRRHDPAVSVPFVEAHVRRLEAMRRQAGLVEREPDGSWIIAPDHLDRAAAYERRQAREVPVVVRTHSAWPIDRQVTADGATWLDRELVADRPEALRDGGFGREVRDALAQRRQWLIGEGLARAEPDGIVYHADLLARLRRRELLRIAGQLSGELGLAFAEARPGQRIEGIYRRPVDLASGRFALIERSRDFTLVPWRPVMERSRGRPVSGMAGGETISWTIDRRRGLGIS